MSNTAPAPGLSALSTSGLRATEQKPQQWFHLRLHSCSSSVKTEEVLFWEPGSYGDIICKRDRAKPEHPAGTDILQTDTIPSQALSLRTFLQHPALTEQEFESHPPHTNAH